MKNTPWSLLAVCILLAGCGTPIQATPASTPEAISILYPASLQPWADALSSCAVQYPEAALYFFQRANPGEKISVNEIGLLLGQPADESTGLNLYQVGWEQVVVIVNRENALEKFSNAKLEQIFSGQVVSWENGSDQPIQVWVLPDQEPTQRIFTQALGLNMPFAPEARLAPDPLAVIKEVAEDEDAIGYLPQSYLNNPNLLGVSQIKTVQLDPPMDQALHQPVIVIVKGEPTVTERNLLTCIQTTSP
ncbi:MAG TPA: substrate-binding domain-containing protein [Anaerolineales bacterium]|nr:substrate-binding domain-containing protein [Anaerolineales bacterium]